MAKLFSEVSVSGVAVAQHFLPHRQAFFVRRLGGVVLALTVVEPRQRDFQPQDLHLVRLLPQRRRRHRDDPLQQLLKDHGVDAGKAHGLPHRIEYAVAVFFSALMVASCPVLAARPSPCRQRTVVGVRGSSPLQIDCRYPRCNTI